MNPNISIEAGMTIGYPRRRLRGEKTTLRLATADESVRLEPGRHLLLARNGRGKTTLLKTLAGLIPAVEGDFGVEGQVQYIDEELRFDPELTSKQIFKAFFTNGLLEMLDRPDQCSRDPEQERSQGGEGRGRGERSQDREVVLVRGREQLGQGPKAAGTSNNALEVPNSGSDIGTRLMSKPFPFRVFSAHSAARNTLSLHAG